MNWIKIEEVKPSINLWVLLSNKYDKWVDRGELEEDGTYSNGKCKVFPTHWKPLPAPPSDVRQDLIQEIKDKIASIPENETGEYFLAKMIMILKGLE